MSNAADSGRALPWLAAERALRAVLLICIAVVLLTHPHTDWQRSLSSFIERIGLNPNRNAIGRALDAAGAFTGSKVTRDAIIALCYGALEAVEGYGLFRRRHWAEYLTIFSTSILFIPEVDELIRKPTGLKVAGLVLNVLVVAYLIWRQIRRRRPQGHQETAGSFAGAGVR